MFFLVTVCCSPGSHGNSRVLGIVAVWSTAVWKSSEHVALSTSVFLSPVYTALSQSVFLERYREGLACPCASVDTHQSRSVVNFYVAQFQRCCVSFPLFPLKGVYFCILVASNGHVSLIIDQLDWQRCQSPCGTVVEWSWDHW